MKKRKKKFNRIAAFLLAMLMVVGSTASAFAASITVTYHGSIFSYDAAGGNYHENQHGKFTANSGNPVYCGEHALPSPMGDVPGNSITLTETLFNDAQIRKVLYYGYLGPEQWSGFSNSAYNDVYNDAGPSSGKTESCGIAVTSSALTRAYQSYGGQGRVYNIAGLSAFESFIAGKPDPKSKGFEAYKLPTPYSRTQDLFTWRYNPAGYVKISKTSTESVSLSLAGARYGVYASQSNAANDTSRLATLTTNSSGSSDTATLNPGTYYVKEVSAPAGFELDTTIHAVTVTSGATKTVSSKETPSKGYVRLEKTSTESVSHSLAGAEYGVYSSSSLSSSSLVGKLTTDASGNTNTLKLLVGTYYVKEIKAPAGYDLDTKTYTVNVTSGTTKVVSSKEQPSKGEVTLEKTSTEPVPYSLAGAEYGVYSSSSLSSSSLVGKLKTDANGKSNVLKVLIGTYYVKELKAPAGFELDTTTHTIKVVSGKKSVVYSKEQPSKGYAKLHKSTKNNSHLVNECPENYSIKGAKYGVYKTESDAKADTNRIDTLTTNAAGNTNSTKALLPDTYYVKEVEAPKGYIIDKVVHPVVVKANKTTKLEVSDAPKFDPFSINVRKKPVEGTDKNLKVEGAEYTIKYYKELKDANGKRITTASQLESLKPYRTWVIKTKANGIANLQDKDLVTSKSDPLFKDDDGVPVGLHGTYSIEETLAPQGFAKTDKVWVQQADFDHKLQRVNHELEDITDNEKPQTVSIELNKVDAETGLAKPQGFGTLKGAKYDLFFFDPIKAEDIKVATLTTDDKGYAKYQGGKPGLYKLVETKASNGYVIDKEYHEVKARITEVNTANFNYVIKSKEKPITVTFDKTSIDKNGNRITVAGAKLQLLDKDKNVVKEFTSGESSYTFKGLKKGTYYIHEVTPPEGYLPLEEDMTVVVKETEKVQNFEVFNEPVPTLKTDALFKSGAKTQQATGKDEVYDTFKYERVLVGEKYIVKGKLIDAESKKTIATAETAFTPTKASGQVKVNFSFNGKNYEGKSLVVTEKLYRVKADGTEKLVATHEDLNDLDQTVNTIKLKTTATDEADGNKNVTPEGKQTIVDRVSYTNLFVGKEYTVKGVLMNKATGEPVLVNGKKIEATKTFVAKEKNGYIDLVFTFDAGALKGETVVAFEDVYEESIKVGSHADINDVEQTVFLPEIKTAATDKVDGGKDLNGAESQIVVDKVTYKSLYPNKAYTMKGTLMDKKTGKAVIVDGKEVTSETVFTPTKEDGSVKLEFPLNASALKGETVVVYEVLYEDGKVLTVHKDIADENQTMYIPKVKTKALFDDGSKNSKPEKERTVIDVFSFENVIKGQKYVVKGELVNKATGEVVSKGETKFTAKNTKDDVEVEFKFDGSKFTDGAELVVTEKLYSLFSGKEKLVASHTDLGDLEQTVNIPKLKTTATDDADGNKNVTPEGKQTIVDRVNYTNLFAGKEYTVTGVLMNKATGKPVLVDGKKIEATKTFVAEKTSGYVDLVFTFDAGALKGETVVAFESLYEKDIEVGTHTDINDIDQTVFIPEIKTAATDKIDGGKDLNGAESQIIVDKVTYKSLYPNKEYTMKGILMDKKTGDPVKVDDKEVTSETVFTPTKADGFVELEFPLNATTLKGETVVVYEMLYEDGEVLTVHTDIADENQSMYVPKVKTKALFDDGSKNSKPEKEMTVIDTFSFENAIKGQKYVIKGELVDKVTGEVVSKGETKFTAKKAKDDVEVEFKFDGSKYAENGAELVVTEKLYSLFSGEEKLVASHIDLDDLEQTVNIPKLKTTATDKVDGGKDMNGAEKQTIVDRVEYKNLFAGKEYTIKGVLMNKATGKPILENGKEVTAEKKFIPEETSGYVDLEFVVDASVLKGETIVVFESLFEDKIEVGTHADINDNDQSIYIPKIHTTATAQIDGGKELLPIETVVISDRVDYDNLIVGQMYEMRGTLVNAKSKEIVAKSSGCFVAEKDNGYVTLDFEIDAKDLKGRHLVVFEELYKLDENGEAVKEVAEHSDITDKGQTVRIVKPDVKTTATSKDDGSKDVLPVKEVTIIDKVEYKDLVIDKEYTVKGILMDKETEKPLLIDGKEITAEKTFVATEKEGFVELEFTFNAEALKGKEIVVFEDLFYEGQKIGTHSDINDEGQTIKVEKPEVKTTATFGNGDKELIANDKMTIIDKVEYKDLVEGKEYTLKGILMDKATGKPILVDGKEVTAETKFVAKEENGFVEMKFTFDGSKLEKKELVVFEKLFYGEEEIGSHEDINDKGQTVKVLPVPPTPKTGDNNNLNGLVMVFTGSLALLLIAYRRRREAN